MVYLDNSATSFPKPKQVYYAYKNALRSFYSNPGRGGYENALKTAEKIYEIRERAAAFFGTDKSENVVFTGNCTQAINMVLKGFLQPGDHVLISDLEHNAVVRPLEGLRRKGKIKYDVFETDIYDDEKTMQSVHEKLRPETKLLFCTHASNVLGVVLPLEKIGAFCKKHGIAFAVDAAQSGGILPLDMRAYHIDFLCLAPHKGLFAPMGTGLLIGEGERLAPYTEGGTGSASLDLAQPRFMPDKFESGTLNVSGIIALGAGIEYIDRVGLRHIYEKDRLLLSYLCEQLKAMRGIELYTDAAKLSQSAPVFSFNLKRKESEAVAEHLAEKGICVRAGLHCAPLAHRKIGTAQRGTVRISPSFFTTESDINYAIDTIKNML